MAGLYGAEKSLLVNAQAPADFNGVTATVVYVSLKNYRRVLVAVHIGAQNASASVVFTPKQASAIAGTGVKSLIPSNLNFYYVINTTPGTTDLPVKTAYTTTFTMTGSGTASSGSSLGVATGGVLYMHVESTDLDLANSFDCFGLSFVAAAASSIFGVTYHLFDPRFEDASPISGRLD